MLTVVPGEGVPVEGPQHFSVWGVPEDTAATWTEMQVTWLTAPANDTASGDGLLPPAVRLAGFIVDGPGTPGEEIRVGGPDLTEFLATTASPAPTLVVVRDTEDADHDGMWHAFAASEGDVPGAAPRLEIVLAADSTCEGDVDGDGDVDFADLLEVLAWWGPCGLCPADLDGNGTVNFDDLLTVLALFGGACL